MNTFYFVISTVEVRVESDVLGLLGDPCTHAGCLRESMQESTREVYRTRIMLVGRVGAGKTSVMRSFSEWRVVPRHLATKGAETDNSVNVYMTGVTEDGTGDFRWEKVWCEVSSKRTSHNTNSLVLWVNVSRLKSWDNSSIKSCCWHSKPSKDRRPHTWPSCSSPASPTSPTSPTSPMASYAPPLNISWLCPSHAMPLRWRPCLPERRSWAMERPASYR